MTKENDYFEIFTNWNSETNGLEILAVGILDGKTYRFNKFVKEEDVRKTIKENLK